MLRDLRFVESRRPRRETDDMYETERDDVMQALDHGPGTTPPEGPSDPGRDPRPLSTLILNANSAPGGSYQQLSDRAVDPESGEQLSKPYLQKLASGNATTAPKPRALRALAVALRKPLAVVQRAAAIQYLDYRATELSGYDDDVRVIVSHLAGMERSERRKWLAMIEAAEQADTDSL